MLKFIHSEKATKFCEISTVDLTYVLSASQIFSGDFAIFCGLLRIYELYIRKSKILLTFAFQSKKIVFLPWKAWDWMEVNLEHPEMSNLLSCEQTGVRASEARVSKGFLSRCMEWRLGTLLKASEGTSDRLLSPSLRLRSVPNPLKAKLCTSAILHWFNSKRVRLEKEKGKVLE